ncbi:MAG: hypothetical protein EPGJADBJ_00497 [Saprospiraceae bacterium]|nr:hypothetical protein [Saprospiraceae bacterium]
MQSAFQQNPAYNTAVIQYDQYYAQNPNQGQGPTDGTYEIPTVVHIIHNGGPENITDAQVLEAIAQANNQLAGGEGGYNTQIQLVLAKIDPDGDCTSGINRVQYPNPDAQLGNWATDITIKNLSRWPTDRYLNIWIVRCILPDNDCNDNTGVWGYSYIGTAGVSPLIDGIVIAHRAFGTTGTATGNEVNTLSHEFGHYLTLLHVWGPDNLSPGQSTCHANDVCLTEGDRCCDTPPMGGIASGTCGTTNTCHLDVPDLPDPLDNYMSYSFDCQNKFTADQTTRMHYALDNNRATLWSDANQICTGIGGYYGANIVIHSNTTWTTSNLPNNGEITITGNLIIEPDLAAPNTPVKLTIGSGVKVHFCGHGRAIVKPNAILDLSGTLTNSCGMPWKGVEVWGNSAQSQKSTLGVNAQGRLIGKTGSVIENAEIGAQLWGPDYFTNAGGIIFCSGTTFRNNRRAVEFAPYQWPLAGQLGQPNNYAASFTGCAFETNNDYPNSSSFEAFLYITGVRGINISGCTFKNFQNISATEINDYGYGIFATDAGFHVSSYCNNPITFPDNCNSYTHTEFQNLGFAIYTANVVGNQPFSVRQARFEDCYFGIYNKAVSQGTLLFNRFKLGNVPNANLTYDQFGTFFESGMSGFIFEENTFEKKQGNVINPVGSYSKDLAFFNGNVLRRNNYIGIKYANVADLTNGYIDPSFNISYGLHYLCNTNTDITETDFLVNASSNIRRDQGLEQMVFPPIYRAAGNKFSQTAAVNLRVISLPGIKYYKNPANPLENPLIYGGYIQFIDADPNDCPENYCAPPCRTEPQLQALKTTYFSKKGQYETAKTAYNAAVAAGNQALADEKSHEMAALRYTMDTAAFMVTLHLLYDTLTFNRDTLRVWYSRMNTPAAQFQLARDYLANGMTTEAASTLSQSAQLFGLNSEDATDHTNLTNIVNLIGTQSVYNLNSQTLSALNSYTSGDGLEAAVFAQNIKAMYGEYFPPRYQLPEGGERGDIGEETKSDSHLALVVSPNPASGFVNFALKGADNEQGVAHMTVVDNYGRTVWQHHLPAGEQQFTWVANVPSGVYVYRLTFGDKAPILTGKIVIVK